MRSIVLLAAVVALGLGGGARAQTAAAATCPTPTKVMGETREALIIVNDSYPGLIRAGAPGGDLPGVRLNRAAAEKSLCATGFHIAEIVNGSKAEITQALAAFQSRLDFANVGLIYYSGHGALVGEDQILLTSYDPAKPYRTWDEFQDASISWSALKSALARNDNLIAIIIDDACRDQPIAPAGTTPQQAGDPRTLAVMWSAGTNVEADAGGADATAFSQSVFHFMAQPGSTVQFVGAQVSQYINNRPRPPDFDQVPEFLNSGNPNIYQWTFLPNAGLKLLPVSNRAALSAPGAPQQGSGTLGVQAVTAFAELATDHRFHLLYWRLKADAVAPADLAGRAFYDALAALQAGDGAKASAGLTQASQSPSAEVAREARTEKGWMEATGRLGQPDITGAMADWQAAETAGSDAAADSLGVIYRDDPGLNWGICRCLEKSTALFRQASVRLASAKADLAFAYLQGDGVQPDPNKAILLFQEAADAGESNAMVWLSAMKRPGAMTLLQKAAFTIHDPQAVSYWARQYSFGYVKDTRDHVQGALQAAADTGDPGSQFWYGYFLECQYSRDHSAGTYKDLKAMFAAAAQGGYNESVAQDKDYNAVAELSRIYAVEKSGRTLAPLAPWTCR